MSGVRKHLHALSGIAGTAELLAALFQRYWRILFTVHRLHTLASECCDAERADLSTAGCVIQPSLNDSFFIARGIQAQPARPGCVGSFSPAGRWAYTSNHSPLLKAARSSSPSIRHVPHGRRLPLTQPSPRRLHRGERPRLVGDALHGGIESLRFPVSRCFCMNDLLPSSATADAGYSPDVCLTSKRENGYRCARPVAPPEAWRFE